MFVEFQGLVVGNLGQNGPNATILVLPFQLYGYAEKRHLR